jgi:glyoxylase-like metal-dependent hydrolase (beta-lactamase superfamily II)
VAPLQYNYNDLPGALRLIYSIHQIKDQEPSWLASSTGGHLITEPAPALQSLEENLIAMLRARGTPEDQIRWGQVDGINEITPHLFQSAHAEASSYFVVSRSGKVLSIDYGYRGQLGMGAGYPYPRNRRPILHGLKPLFEKTGASRIDGVLVTHFHDDHVNGIPMLQRLYGASCYAPDTFAFILANPEAYAFPCTWPEPIDVTELPADKPFTWEEYTFSFYPMSGHTRYSALVSFEVDGKRVVATGDQFFFQDQANPGRGPSAHNHVYQNGAMLNSIRKSQQQLKELDPQIILPGHGPAYEVPVELHEWTDRYAREYEDLHRSLMPLSPTDVDFEVDSRAGWLEPVRHLGTGGSPIRYTAHLRNPFPHSASLHVRLVAPEGWTTQQGAVTLPGRAEGTIELVLTPPPDATCRRTPVALELTADERPFGQVAVALVTIGYPRF